MKDVTIGGLTVGNDRPLLVIAGPCQLESLDHAQMIAGTMAEACAAAGAQFVFKASYDKANRTSLTGRRGLGMEAGLEVLAAVRAMGVPVLTDVHDVDQARGGGGGGRCDPDPGLPLPPDRPAAGRGRNRRRGQHQEGPVPGALGHGECGRTRSPRPATTRILLTERGVSFGYNTLVADMRTLPIMARTGYPVIMDATHSVQQPGGQGDASGGQREFAPVMARAAVASASPGCSSKPMKTPTTRPPTGRT